MSKYVNMPVCDLRQLNDVQTIKVIEKIANIALLILPKDADDDVKNALESVPKANIASVIYLNKDDNLVAINGLNEITDNDFKKDGNSFIIINGVGIIQSISKEAKGTLSVNGVIVIHESLKNNCSFTFGMINGVKVYLDFDSYKGYQNEIKINAQFLSYLKPKTLLLAGNNMIIENDVTVDLLEQTQPILLAGNKIICYDNICGYIKATATVGNSVEVLTLENDEQRN